MYKIIKTLSAQERSIFKLINSKIRCKFLDLIMPIITYLGSFQFLCSFCIISFIIPIESLHSLSIESSLSLAVSGSIAQIIKRNINRKRPYVRFKNIYTRKIGTDNYSFPSGHTTGAFSLAMMCGLFFPSTFVVCIVLASLVGFSRIYLGVHYPSDVTAGLILGIVSSLTIYNIFL